MARTKTTALQAAIEYLRSNAGPQPVKAVCEAAATAAKLKGKTPAATVAAKIYLAAKKGETFRIVSRGTVELLPAKAATETTDAAPVVEQAKVEKAKTEAAPQAKPHPKPSARKREKAGAAA